MEKLLALDTPEIKQGWLDCEELGIGPEHVEELIGLALDEELNQRRQWTGMGSMDLRMQRDAA